MILRFLAPEFTKSVANLLAWQQTLRHGQGPVSEDTAQRVLQAAHWMRQGCDNLGLPVSGALADTLKGTIEKGERSRESLHGRIISLVESTDVEIQRYGFAAVAPERAQYFDKEDLFGAKVATAFPLAKQDIREAGSCLALGLDTAAVFHLTRAAEWGLRKVARAVGVTVTVKTKPVAHSTWNEVATAIDDKIDALMQTSAGVKRAKKLTYWGDLNSHIRSYKDAWRNEIMHARTTYSPEEALIIFVHVRGFMQRAAAGPG